MATADKAKQRLLDSMRKSKAGAAKKPAAASRPKAARKTAARRAPAKAAQQRRTAGAAAMTAVTQCTSDDPYQSPGRIWPD